jgi:hypothetical protein
MLITGNWKPAKGVIHPAGQRLEGRIKRGPPLGKQRVKIFTGQLIAYIEHPGKVVESSSSNLKALPGLVSHLLQARPGFRISVGINATTGHVEPQRLGQH